MKQLEEIKSCAARDVACILKLKKKMNGDRKK